MPSLQFLSCLNDSQSVKCKPVQNIPLQTSTRLKMSQKGFRKSGELLLKSTLYNYKKVCLLGVNFLNIFFFNGGVVQDLHKTVPLGMEKGSRRGKQSDPMGSSTEVLILVLQIHTINSVLKCSLCFGLAQAKTLLTELVLHKEH